MLQPVKWLRILAAPASGPPKTLITVPATMKLCPASRIWTVVVVHPVRQADPLERLGGTPPRVEARPAPVVDEARL